MKAISLDDIENLDVEELEQLLDETEENKDIEVDPPETDLEFNDRLITPSDRIKHIPTISREMLSTSLSDTTTGIIIHYDNVQMKYDILKQQQLCKKIDFERKLQEKIERAKIYGFTDKIQIFKRNFGKLETDYKRKIHLITALGKSGDGFNLKTIKTEFKRSSEDIKTIEINDPQNKKRRLIPW